MSEQTIPKWMTHKAVEEMADGGFGVAVTALSKEVLRCWDLLETQANEIDNLKNRLAG